MALLYSAFSPDALDAPNTFNSIGTEIYIYANDGFDAYNDDVFALTSDIGIAQ